jgi:hypothetical protein
MEAIPPKIDKNQIKKLYSKEPKTNKNLSTISYYPETLIPNSN